jgi:hypothetical protein
MPRTWSRLHEYLGAPPGPVTFEMVRQSVDDKLGEADGLDWRESLPDGRNPGTEAGFAKDVAAVADLLIRGFGVQVPGGAPVMTWGFLNHRSFLCARFVRAPAPGRAPAGVRLVVGPCAVRR